ncbi:MAG: hypothetical protein ACREH5_08190 [Candidatus Omnitrophota bacterium]
MNREKMEHEIAEVYRRCSDIDKAIISHATGFSHPDAKTIIEFLHDIDMDGIETAYEEIVTWKQFPPVRP